MHIFIVPHVINKNEYVIPAVCKSYPSMYECRWRTKGRMMSGPPPLHMSMSMCQLTITDDHTLQPERSLPSDPLPTICIYMWDIWMEQHIYGNKCIAGVGQE